MLSLEMKAGGMVDHIPVATIGSFGTAAWIDHAAVGVDRFSFSGLNGPAASQPATRGGRRSGTAEGTAEIEFDRYAWVGASYGLARIIQLSVARQGLGVHADHVGVRSGREEVDKASIIGGPTGGGLIRVSGTEGTHHHTGG